MKITVMHYCIQKEIKDFKMAGNAKEGVERGKRVEVRSLPENGYFQ